VQRFREAGQQRQGAVGGEPRYPDWLREDFSVLLELLRDGDIHSVFAERLPLAEARRAHEMLETTAAKGNPRAPAIARCERSGDSGSIRLATGLCW
jgi:hypothetical protein